MQKLIEASVFTIRLTELDDRYWALRDEEQDRKHAEFLAGQLELTTYEIHGLRFSCPSGVYHPNELSSTRFILRELVPSAARFGRKVLDIGTGSGALGITMASLGKTVTATDIDPKAVECAKANALANNTEVTIFQSDMFDAVEDRDFDLIVFNTPLFDKPLEHPVEHIACDPGGALTRRFLAEARRYLSPDGLVAVLTSNIGHKGAIFDGLSAYDHYLAAAEYSSSSGVWRWLIFAKPT